MRLGEKITAPFLAVTALLGSWAVTGCQTELDVPTSGSEQQYVLTPEDQRLVQEAWDRVIVYWVQQGVGEVATTTFVVLSNDETYSCSQEARTYDINAREGRSSYCPASNKVVFTAADINSWKAWAGVSGIDFIVGHEVGHKVQATRNELDVPVGSTDAYRAVELQATEYAGLYLATRYDRRGMCYIAILMQSPGYYDDELYGTSEQQANAVLVGIGLTLEECERDLTAEPSS